MDRPLRQHPSLATQQRVDRVLAHLNKPITEGEALRQLRAVVLLERCDNPATRGLLEQPAEGALEARLTRAASAALERLTRRPWDDRQPFTT